MRLLNEELTERHFKGALGLRDHLRRLATPSASKRVHRLVRWMGHAPVYPKPRLSVPSQSGTPYPCLLREQPATVPNEA